MSRILCAVFSAVLLAGIALAQDTAPQASGSTPGAQQMPASSTAQPTSQPPAANRQAPMSNSSQAAGEANSTPKIAPGSVIPALLTKSIDAKKAKAGDEVVAKVTEDMKTKSGAVLVPKDTKIVGHVTGAQARSKEQKESQLGIAFDRAVTKDGKELQLPMSIQAVIGQENSNPSAAEGNEPSYSAPTGGSGGSMGGGGMAGGGSGRPQSRPSSSNAGNMQNDSARESNGRPQITGQTQGVVGISNLKLTAAPTGTPGSILSSDKNNVKLDSGTFLLLKVNP